MKICKKLCISILSVFATACLSLGIITLPKVNASAETPQLAQSLSMNYGASVRINKTESYEDNGIRFSATISEAEYNVARLMDNAVFGMFIMPESYLTRFGDLSAENVNLGGVYDWKENKSNEYFYGGSEIQAESHRILAMTYTELPNDTEKDGYKVINGSVVAIKDDNLDMNYVGRAFIRYEVDGFYFYEMAEWSEGYVGNNVRSITEVADKALKDPTSNLNANEQKALTDAYLVKSYTVDGYTAITSEADFAAMNENGKYYLANDITVSAAYANAFSGVLNGNGKKITVNGTSLFGTFTGTLKNVQITTNASIISSMQGGLVDGVTVNHTYSDSAANAIAAKSAKVARVENCILYTDNNATAFVADGGAFVSNCVETTDTTAKYKEITFATENGQIRKFIKEGASISDKFIYAAETSLVGSVNEWNKEFAAVTSDDTYYATESETLYDSTANWKKIADSAIINGTAVNVATPYGYETVHAGNREWTTTSIEKYTSVRFAAKMSGYFLLKSDWTIYSDANDWMQIALDQQEDGSWTVTVYGAIYNGSAWINSYQKTDITATTLAEAMNFVSFGYTTYATEVYVIAAEEEEETPVNTVEVVSSAMSGTTVAEGETAPEGFAKVSTRTIADADKGSVFADVDVSQYSELSFAFKSSSWMLFEGWGKYTHQVDIWVTVQLINNFDGTWTVTASGTSHTFTYSGTTLKEILKNWYNDSGKTFYVTELIGVKVELKLYGVQIVEQAIAGSTATTAVNAPEGFEYAYEYASIPAGTAFVDADISGYSEVKFNMWLNSGYICIVGWGAYAENSGWGKQWTPITLTNNGDGTWTILIEALIAGAGKNPYSYTVSGTKLSEVLATWFDFTSGATVYITEIRGEKLPGWGEKIADSALANATVSTEEAPAGYETVFSKSGLAKGDFEAINLSDYSEIRFQVKASSWILFGGWGTYYDKRAWIPWTLTKDESGVWTLRIDTTINGKDYYEEVVSGSTLKEALNKFYSDAGSITVYSTEVRAIKDTTPVWGDKIINSALGNATVTEESAPDKFENVYEKTDLTAGAFANINLSQYKEVRFWIKLNSGWFVLNNSWETYYAHKNWTKVTLVNNNDGTWALSWYTQAQNTNGETTSESPFTATVSGETLKQMLVNYYGSDTTNAFVTELRGIKKDTPVVEVPEITEQPVALEPQEHTALWGEEVTANGAVGFIQTNNVTVPNGYAYVVAGQPATTANSDGVRVGEFFEAVDISEYTEVRFAFKSSSWMLFGGWGSYVHVPDEWISVKMRQTSTDTWEVTVYAANAVSGVDPCTATYTGSTLQQVLISWYNATGETFYMTDVRGVKGAVKSNSVVIDACVLTANVTLDTTVAAPNGFESVYKVSGTFDTNKKSTTDLSGYSEVRFALKSEKYFLISGWAIYFKESYTDWAPVIMKNNGDGTWEVSVYADVFTGSAVANPYTTTYTGNSVATILADWYNGANIYVTELCGVPAGVASDAKVSNLVCTTVYNTTDVTAPDGYDNVYRKDGLEKGDFATIDISSYAEVNFQIQSSSWILYGSWAGSIHTPNKWIDVRLVKQAGNAWAVYVNGKEEQTLTYTGTTLNEVLALWYNDNAATFYVTELRGVYGSYETSQIKAIAMLQSDKTNTTKKAALELSKVIKDITGVELLVEYYNNLGELDTDKCYLVLGTLAAAEVNTSLLTTETGYIMKKAGHNVMLYATTSDGMYNAVYGFLNTYFGVEYYTDSAMTYTDDNPMIGGAEMVVFNPSIEYTWAVDGLLTDGANGDFNWAYVNRLGYSNLYTQLGGGGWHNFLTVISEEKYGASGTVAQHSEWFVTKKDPDNQSFKTLNIANYGDEIAVAVANEFAVMIAQTPTVDVWQFSAPDYVDSALTSDVYVAFMNKVAANLNGQISRKVNLMLLAYNSTFAAPTTAFAPQTNVGFTVMAAPIDMNYYYGFDNTTFTGASGKTNAWYLEQITAWGEKADELYVWNYSTYFDNYFVPLDTITNMQSKYQAYAAAGVTGIYDQGSGEANATDWAELKVYLKAELAKNVNADVDALIENFMKGYFGEAAAPYMLQFLNAQQAHYATIASNMRGGHITRDSLFDKSYWGTSSSNSMLTEWYGYIQSALNVTTDATLKARIQKEALTIRYLNQVLFNYSGTKKTLTVTTVAGATVTDSLEQIITDAKALGITRFAEGTGWVCNDGTLFGTNNLKDGAIDNLA